MKRNLFDRVTHGLTGSLAMMLCAMLFLITGAGAQDAGSRVSGTVSDAAGNPVAGVSVIEAGTTRGAVTSADGNYSIVISGQDAVIEFSFFGMKSVQEAVAGRTRINVIMHEDAIDIEQVVAVGYGTMKRSDLTGAVASITGELMENRPYSSFDNALRGQIAGVQVRQTDGQPGGGASIRIRGTSSINGTNEPLYVVDGVPLLSENVTDGQGLVINPLTSINPNDIESIEVLKDASATAIYGARGANGVILITTKKGREGRGEVKFNATVSIQSVEKAYTMLDAAQLAQIGREAYENANLAIPSYFQDPNVETKTNWMNEIFRTGIAQNYQVGYSGGTDRISYNLSAGYFDQQGVLIKSDFNRYSFRGQLAADVNKYIGVGTNLGYSQMQANGYGNASSALTLIAMAHDMNPALSVFDENGEYTFRNDLSSSTGVYGGNPVATANKASVQNKQNRFTGNVYMDVKLFSDKLVLKTQFGVDDIFSLDRMYFPNDLAVAVDGPGKGNVGTYTTKSWNWDNTLTYTNQWAGKHNLSAMVGQTAQKMTQNVVRLGVKDFEDNRLGYNDLSVGRDVWLNQTSGSAWSMLSYISRIHYSYDNRYLVTFTGRVDGSSKFGVNNKYGFFPSIGGAWRISQEQFMGDVDVISNLKLRLSYGVVGNAGIPPYQSQGTLVSVNPPFGQGINGGGLGPMTLPNADLAWESTEQYNVGVDVGLFDNRLNIVADYYYKYTSDLLYNVELPLYSGYKYTMRNLGDLSNKGVELSISGVPVTTRDFQWTSTFNIDHNVTRIEKLNVADGESVGTGEIRLVVGDKLNNVWGYKTNGIAQINEDLTQVAQWANRPMVAGEQKYVDKDNNGTIDQNDQFILGNLTPKFTFGFNNQFTYKNFNLNLFIEGTYGNKVINYTRKHLESLDGSRNNITTVLNRWTPENPGATMPRADVSSNSGAFSNRWVEDGSYLHIRDLTLGYTLPKRHLRGIASVNLFVSFENLYTWTKYSGYDPSIGGGLDNNLYPTSKKYSFGASFTF